MGLGYAGANLKPYCFGSVRTQLRNAPDLIINDLHTYRLQIQLTKSSHENAKDTTR